MRTTLFSLIVFSFFHLDAQLPFQFVVSFTDKGGEFSIEKPGVFLSERAIQRRQKQEIEIVEEDLPVSRLYLSQVRAQTGIQIRSVSKWFNDCVIEIKDSTIVAKIRSWPFVKAARLIPANYNKSSEDRISKLDIRMDQNLEKAHDYYGNSYVQSHMLACDYLHELGFRGRGMLLAVIDAGFLGYEGHPFLAKLQAENRVLATRDFIDQDDYVFQQSWHGTYVLSTMAADVPGNMVGTAPEASYLLLRSEDGRAEYILEEYFWVEAAEFADSAGADVVNTSLGYTQFDDSLQDHTYADMNGKTARISIAASRAARKGMLIMISAGNSGTTPWQKIGAPADAFDIISVGAVNGEENIAAFSSRGPSADGRIKPELCAMGNNVIVGNPDGTASTSNGTSFSSPVLAGMASCLWQANPDASWKEVREALIQSGTLYSTPDTNMGYGIPNAIMADSRLKGNIKSKVDSGPWYSISPNPFHQKLILTYKTEENAQVTVRFSDVQGRLVSTATHWLMAGRISYLVLEGNDIPKAAGTYVAEFITGDMVKTMKVVKY